MADNYKIVVITNGNFFSRIILSEFITLHSDWISGILIITGDYKGQTGFKSLFHLSKVTAWPYLFYKVLSILYYKIIKFFGYPSPLFVKDLAINKGILIKESRSVKLQESIDWIKNKEPDLIVSVSCPQLIGKKILECSRLGGINIHSSLLPRFAGLAPYFWVLSEKEKKTGITIHYMCLKFDQGNILIQKELDIQSKESAFHLFYRLAKLGQENLNEAILSALNGEKGMIQNLSNYSYFSNPSFKGYLNLRRNCHELFRLSEFGKTLSDLNE
jgi:folate-dependent phosphoribosylglycinamide formyltransferase PurN